MCAFIETWFSLLKAPAIGNTALNQSAFHFSTSIKLIACQLGWGGGGGKVASN